MKRRLYVCFIGLFILALPGLSLAAEFNVADPAQLQSALTTAQDNGEDDTINIAAGTYDISAAGTLTFVPSENKALTLIGSDGAILDGGNAVNVLDINTAMLVDDSNAHVSIQNLTIQNGDAVGFNGGGLRFSSSRADLTIEGAALIGNRTSEEGGAAIIGSDSGDITLRNSTFSENNSHECSGAVELEANSGQVTFTGNTFTGNIADTCGAGAVSLYLSSGEITLSGNTFQYNESAEGSGGAGYVVSRSGPVTINDNVIDGNMAADMCGGLCVESDSGAIIVHNNTVNGNTASGAGSELGSYGGMRVETDTGPITLTQNTFSGNAATGVVTPGGEEGDLGGFMASSESGLITLVRNVLTGNSATNRGGGGAAMSQSGDVVVVNNIVAGNTAEVMGGGFGAVTVSGEMSIINNTIVDNDATDAASFCGGLYIQIDDGGPAGVGQANIYNNIIWGNSSIGDGADLYISDDADGDGAEGIVRVFHNDYSDSHIIDADQYTFGDNIDSDPLLTADYHIPPTSPCIDVGDNSAPDLPAFDFDGGNRLEDGDDDGDITVDMGADEHSDQDIAVDSVSVVFGELGISSAPATETFTISNEGDAPLSITDMELSGDNTDEFNVDSTCGSSPIPGGTDCVVTVQFDPDSIGVKSAILTITSDDPDEPIIAVALAGIGIIGSIDDLSSGGGGGGGCFIESLGLRR